MNHQPTVIQCFEQLIHRNNHNHTLGADKTRNFKNRAHKKVIEDLLTHFDAIPLTDISQLKGRSGYGKSTIERIQEIITTGTLQELDDGAPTDPAVVATQELLGITGIGPVKAKKVIEQGGSLALLREAIATDDQEALKAFTLTAHQRMGLKYYEDLKHRIPHDVIRQFDEVLQTECKAIPNPCEAIICGSYRREKPDSGDIDILLTRGDWEEDQQAEACLRVLLKHLEDEGILVDHLTSTTKCKTKYMGFLRIPNYPRACRVDIRAVVHKQYVPALAYFTGSGEENIRLRGIALKKKMKLSEYGIKNTDTGVFLELKSEEDMYVALGEAYIPPVDR